MWIRNSKKTLFVNSNNCTCISVTSYDRYSETKGKYVLAGWEIRAYEATTDSEGYPNYTILAQYSCKEYADAAFELLRSALIGDFNWFHVPDEKTIALQEKMREQERKRFNHEAV